jgi:hypothetical protein
MRGIILLLSLFTLAACTLSSSTEDPLPESTAVSVEPTITPGMTVTPRPTTTPLPVNTPAPQCTRRIDWFTYIVRSGDTLADIAERANTNVQALVDGNCLANPDLLTTGQQLLVPRLPADPASPTPTNTPPPALRAPVNFAPVQAVEAGVVLLEANSNTQIAWTDLPGGTVEVRFYALQGASRLLLGSDTSVGDGVATLVYRAGSAGPLGDVIAEALDAGGNQRGQSQPREVRILPAVPRTGGVGITQTLAGDAGNVSLLRGANATLTYVNAPSGITRVRFFLTEPDAQPELIGLDDNPQDGWRANWTIPPNLRGDVVARAYDSGDNIIGQSFPLGVGSGPPPGQGCQLRINASINYFADPNTEQQPAIGSLNANDTVEVVGRSLAGWWAFDPTGATDVEDLAWINENADVTEGANC